MTFLLAALGTALIVGGFFGMVHVAPARDGTPHWLTPTAARMRLWITVMSAVMILGLAALYFAFD